uniref:Uncharacterized protein n=1 Tax=Panagrellus redivivus TaxID=6233 RepID=A0A7E4VUB1_PANRE
MSLLLVFTDFADWTSAAAIPQIHYAINRMFRIAWIIIYIVLLCLAIWQVATVIIKFLSYPSAIVPYMQFGSQQFPVINICPGNPYPWDKVNSTGGFGNIAALASQYALVMGGGWSDVTPDTFGLNAEMTRYEKTSFANEALVLLAAQLTTAQIDAVSPDISDFILQCNFNGVPCSTSDFTAFYDATYGKCYSFNSNGTFKTNRAGTNYGLSLVALAAQQRPNGNKVMLPMTTGAGVILNVNSINESPEMHSQAITAPVKQQTLIGFTKTRISRLGKPYSECASTDAMTTLYYPNNIYTQDLCYNACMQKHIYESIQCADPRLGRPAAFPVCTTAKLTALRSLRDNQDKNNANYFDPIQSCDCKLPCDEVDYDKTVTFALAPQNGYNFLPSSMSDQTYSCSCVVNCTFGSTAECTSWFQENTVHMKFYFESLDYDLYEETASYTFSQMTNELGGQLSLFLGISIISIVEMGALIVVAMMYVCYGRRYRVHPDEDDYSKDIRIQDVANLRDELDIHENLDARLRNRAARLQREREAVLD